MSIVTEVYYRSLTGDYTTAASAIEINLQEAEDLLGEYLQRTLPYGTYTERLKLWSSRVVYPSAVPIESISATAASGEVYDDATLMNVSPDDIPALDWPEIPADEPIGGRRGTDYEAHYWYATITYTGGFTVDTLPVSLRRAIVKLARALPLEFTGSARLPGTGMTRVGDVQVNYNKAELEMMIDQYVPGLSKQVDGYRLDRL